MYITMRSFILKLKKIIDSNYLADIKLNYKDNRINSNNITDAVNVYQATKVRIHNIFF